MIRLPRISPENYKIHEVYHNEKKDYRKITGFFDGPDSNNSLDTSLGAWIEYIKCDFIGNQKGKTGKKRCYYVTFMQWNKNREEAFVKDRNK